MKINLNNDKVFNELKENVQFLSGDSSNKVIMIGSANRQEGRSTVASYLSIVLASSGEKTLLIDCDQKNPSIHSIFDVTNDKGLVNFLSGEIKYEEGVKPTKQEHLFVLTAGTKPLNYAKLLTSPKFSEFILSLKERFDYIIMDTSPLTEGAEAQSIAKNADGCVLVTMSGKTEKKSALKAKEILQKANVNIIGVFLNK